jgi:hypothetical protein
VRERLVDTLRLDLYGPWADHALSTERLPGWVRPSNWYLTGFLIPSGMSPEKRGDADEDDDIDVVPELAGLGEESNEERKAAKKGFFPSSMGLSFLVPKEAQSVTVIGRWGDYAPIEIEGDDGKPLSVWQRKPQERTVPVTFTGAKDSVMHNVPDSGGLELHVVEKLISAQDLEQHIPQGTRSVSVFLVNNRPPNEEKPDAAYAFQAKIDVRSEHPFVPRPDNRAVARALRKRLGIETPRWHAFQIAFLLLNLPGLADPRDPNRATVDLLFFPTGGGKTEAYFGLAAFAMVLRRLRHPGEKGRAGAGVSVIMRYTLRLLTLDQLARAAGLVCALELEREKDAARYGEWPFEIGLWVGKAATPNILGHKGDGRSDSARTKVRQFKADPKSKPSPIPLENCPWCATRFGPNSFALLDDKGHANDDHPTQLRIVCLNFECDFSRRGLPIVAVDEPIYHRLPAFLIATVDKFASLPWVGQAGALLGGAERHDSAGFYGAAEPGKGKRLAAPLPPPDLVIQDELHLISGPLGTMAGLYEAAIEALCVREIDGRAVRPKIIASTATVRRAQDQIQALFARPLTQVFPPPGPDRRDSFFARMVPSSETAARLYLGIAAQGRNPKVIMRKVWLALMGAAERAYRDAGGHRNEQNPADPYMTLLGYFNGLRELGGARRILEEEVQNTIKAYGSRKRIGEARGLFQDRKTFSEVVELTSRVSTDKVAEARRRLETPFHKIEQRVDCAIATNMISVGLDISRLGLMGVVGQPKTHAEYIQATSRVGRDDKRPGLVVTLLNIHKPRDRSHYERFRHYHETFYRAVEVASVTPFSARSLDRGFAGALVGMARHARSELTPAQGVEQIAKVRVELERRLLASFLERVRQQPFADEAEREERLRSVQNRIVDLLDSWRKIFEDYRAAGVHMQYQKYELKQPKPLLREILDKDFESERHRKFRANRSLRDVEPEVNLFLKDLSGMEVEDQA